MHRVSLSALPAWSYGDGPLPSAGPIEAGKERPHRVRGDPMEIGPPWLMLVVEKIGWLMVGWLVG